MAHCPFSAAFAPVVGAAARLFPDPRVNFFGVDMDREPGLGGGLGALDAAVSGVRGFPALLLFQDGAYGTCHSLSLFPFLLPFALRRSDTHARTHTRAMT